MAFLGSGIFCGERTYAMYREQRVIDASQLKPDELFTAMLLVDSEAYEAAIIPARIEARYIRAGQTIVRFSLLDKELTTQTATSQPFSNGYMNEIEGITIYETSRPECRFPIEQLYFRDFYEDMYDVMEEERQVLLLPV